MNIYVSELLFTQVRHLITWGGLLIVYPAEKTIETIREIVMVSTTNSLPLQTINF